MSLKKKYGLLIITLLAFSAYVAYQIYDPNRHIWGYSVYGIDVSKWQGQIDWQKVKNDRIVFTFIKATQGEEMIDTHYQKNWKMADSLQLHKGVYHYFKPTQSATIQAEHFITQSELDSTDLPPVVDVEDAFNDKKAMQDSLQIWIDLVENHYKRKPMIYASRKYYQAHLKDRFSNYPIWIAQYQRFPEPKITKGKENGWVFWQFSNTGRVWGIKGNVDLDVFNGSYKEFLEWKGK